VSQQFEIVITATGEVRDADGNLISSEPVEARTVVTEEQLAEIVGKTEGEQA
jgi:hypothetical protein